MQVSETSQHWHVHVLILFFLGTDPLLNHTVTNPAGLWWIMLGFAGNCFLHLSLGFGSADGSIFTAWLRGNVYSTLKNAGYQTFGLRLLRTMVLPPLQSWVSQSPVQVQLQQMIRWRVSWTPWDQGLLQPSQILLPLSGFSSKARPYDSQVQISGKRGRYSP